MKWLSAKVPWTKSRKRKQTKQHPKQLNSGDVPLISVLTKTSHLHQTNPHCITCYNGGMKFFLFFETQNKSTHLPLSRPTPHTRIVWIGCEFSIVSDSGSINFKAPSSRSMNRSLPCKYEKKRWIWLLPICGHFHQNHTHFFWKLIETWTYFFINQNETKIKFH